MKITHRTITGRQVYDARLGERKVKAIYRGDVKIYPDNAARIRQLRLDVSAWNTPESSCWQHALNAVAVHANSSRCVKLTADRSYMVGNTWGIYPLASYLGGGLFEFAYGEGPLAQNVRPGDTAAITLRLPSLPSDRIGGGQPDTRPVSRHDAPPLPGTEVRGYFSKGQKKISTGVAIRVESLPSGTLLVNRHQQQNGHVRGERNWHYGWIDPVAGDTQVLLTVTPHQPRGGWGGYFVYPAVARTLTARIIQITREA